MTGAGRLGILLLVGGVLGLIYGGFTYTRRTHEATVGPILLRVQDKERINVPIWVSLAALAAGGALLVFGNKK